MNQNKFYIKIGVLILYFGIVFIYRDRFQQFLIPGLLPILVFILYNSYGFRETIRMIINGGIGVLIFFYFSYLLIQIKGTGVSNFINSITIEMSFIITVVLFILTIFMLIAPTAAYNFIKNLWGMVSDPKIYKPIYHLIITFLLVVMVFGFIYSSIYVFVGHETFKNQMSSSPEILDFFHYSLLVPTTLGFADLVPNHPLTKIVTTIEIFIGIIIFVLYLGVIIGEISDTYPHQEGEE